MQNADGRHKGIVYENSFMPHHGKFLYVVLWKIPLCRPLENSFMSCTGKFPNGGWRQALGVSTWVWVGSWGWMERVAVPSSDRLHKSAHARRVADETQHSVQPPDPYVRKW